MQQTAGGGLCVEISAYGGVYKATPGAVFTVDGHSFLLAHAGCAACGYNFFFPCLREHEPTYCPNCGQPFGKVVQP